MCHLVKSGSFSGYSAQQEGTDRMTSSDPQGKLASCCKTSSESEESEEEASTAAICRVPLRSGRSCSNCEDGILASNKIGQFAADSDVEKNSLGNNSFSEQAWDNYQVKCHEKYQSKAFGSAGSLRYLIFFFPWGMLNISV